MIFFTQNPNLKEKNFFAGGGGGGGNGAGVSGFYFTMNPNL